MKVGIRASLIFFSLLALLAPVQIASAQSPTPVTLTWPGYGGGHGGHIGEHFSYYCPPFDASKGYIVGSNLYGTDLYSDDSGICGAAVHAGVITTTSGGPVTIEIRPSPGSYTGSTRNGVTSRDATEDPSRSVAFAFYTGQPVGTPAASNCDWTGTWKVGDQTFSFSQSGVQVSGTGISDPTWRLTGTVAGNVLTGKWSDHTGSGSIRIVMSGDCSSFDSAWGAGEALTPFTGHGVRTSASGGAAASCLTELEKLSVSSRSNEKVSSNTVLKSGQNYAVIVTGVMGLYPNTSVGYDALYDYRTPGQEVRPSFGSFIFVNDRPLADRITASGGNIAYRTDHTYAADITGSDQPLAVNFYEGGDYSDNAGDLTISLCLAAPNPHGGMTLEAPRRLALPDELLLIPVSLRNAANVANLNFDLEYDPAVIKIEGTPGKGDLLDNALFSANPATAGLLHAGFAQTSGLSGNGTVLNVQFRITGKPGDKTPLALRVTTINDPGGAVLNIAQLSGEIDVTNPDGTLPEGGSCQKQLESLTVSSQTPTTVTSKTLLTSGQTYTLVASGVVGLFPNTNTGFDALYDYRKPGQEGRVNLDAPGNDSLLVINGQWLSDLITASSGSIAYRSDHVYAATLTGRGQQMTAKFSDWGSYDDNAGTLNIKLCTGGGGSGPNAPGGIPHGDCDGDLKLTEIDALCAIEMSVQLRPVQLIVDMDNSGDVTSRDAVIILQKAVGK